MSTGFTKEEQAAMRARAKELKAAAEGEEAILAALKKMSPDDRALGKQVDALVRETAPELVPKTWYGMPAYANEAGKTIVAFKNAGKFGQRYSTLEFQEAAKFDDGDIWPVSYAVVKWSPAVEKKIVELVKTATS